ncbi:MAG: glutathione S-transferase family protein [Paracoccaceae bacterium]|nr:glutathione S-transferase family protein [Paracoccaceae bacterium]
MLTLYGVYRSRATRPLWLLAEIGLPFTHVPVIQVYRLADPSAPGTPLNTASPEFVAINPQAAVPAMQDDGLVLTESMAITQHIARKYGGALGPQGLNEAALADQWAMFAVTSIEAPALEILYTIAGGLADTPEGAAKIKAAATALMRPLARLEQHLTGRDWLMGDRFTVADIMVAECLRYAQGHAPVMAAHPGVSAWIARCQARPAFVAMMEKRNAEPA